MSSAATLRSPYDIRVKLVQDTIQKNSKLGVHVLHALNSIPEKAR